MSFSDIGKSSDVMYGEFAPLLAKWTHSQLLSDDEKKMFDKYRTKYAAYLEIIGNDDFMNSFLRSVGDYGRWNFAQFKKLVGNYSYDPSCVLANNSLCVLPQDSLCILANVISQEPPIIRPGQIPDNITQEQFEILYHKMFS